MKLLNKLSQEYGTRGFTLLELMVVIFIIGVLTTLAVPALMDNRGRLLNDTAERLVLLINQARQESVLSSSLWQVVVDPITDSYYFRKRIGTAYEKIVDGPFVSPRETSPVDFDNLAINGQPLISRGDINLFPTGEQDALRLILRTGKLKREVTMGPVGPAEVKLP